MEGAEQWLRLICPIEIDGLTNVGGTCELDECVIF
jgi:hypothetical protein